MAEDPAIGEAPETDDATGVMTMAEEEELMLEAILMSFITKKALETQKEINE